MIIQCSECQARFKLADDKVKPEGTKVRCSKCRHIFTVHPPEPEETTISAEPEEMPASSAGEETDDFFAASTPENEQPAGPKLDIDFSAFEADESQKSDNEEHDEDDTLKGLFGEEPEETPADTSASSFDEFSFGEEEQEGEDLPFSFNATEDTSLPADDQESTTAPLDEGDDQDDFFGSLTDETDLVSEEPAQDFDFGAETTEDDFGLTDESPSEAEDFFATDTDEKPAEISSPFEDSLAETQDDDFSWDEDTAEGSTDDFEFEESTPSLEQPFEEDGSEDKSETESSFLFGEPEVKEETPAAVAPAKRETSEESATKKSKKATKTRKQSEGKSRKSPWRGLIFLILILLLALSAAGAYLFLKQGNLDIAAIMSQVTGQAPPTQPAGQIQITDLTSAFVNNREAGELFIIHGQAVNQFKEVRSAITVKGVLYNQNGKALLQQTVFCGNRLTATELQEWPFAKIEEAMNNQFGDSLSNLNVAPGARIPFTIVFKNLPRDLSEFTVEMADSKPGSKQ